MSSRKPAAKTTNLFFSIRSNFISRLYYIRFLLFCKQGNQLTVVRIYKLVNNCHFRQLIAAGQQNIRITDKAARIAGYGNYFLRAVVFRQGSQLLDLSFRSGARRIKTTTSKPFNSISSSGYLKRF